MSPRSSPGWARIGVACFVATVSLAACGAQRQGGGPGATRGPARSFAVQVTRASFPSSQRLAEHVRLVISVRNAGAQALPDVAVTVTDPGLGTSVAPFATYLNAPGLASHSRPVWVVDQPPGPCGYSCQAGGSGGGATSSSNTWALGRLAPGASATFSWGLTAVSAGSFRVHYQVAAGLSDRERVVPIGAPSAAGTFRVTVNAAPVRSYINDQGEIVTVSTGG